MRGSMVRFAALVFLTFAAGCGGGGASRERVARLGSTGTRNSSASRSSPASAQRTKALAYSRCVRSNGVPNYPDPDNNGNLPKGNAQSFRVSSSQYQAAEQACAHLLPSGGTASLTQCLMTGDCSRSVVQPALAEGRRFARCMRSHGVTHWPDLASTRWGAPPSKSPRRAFPSMPRAHRRCSPRLATASVDPALSFCDRSETRRALAMSEGDGTVPRCV